MRRATVIKAVLSLSLFYIFLQLFSLKNLFTRKTAGNGGHGGNPSKAILDLVFIFTTRCQHQGIPIFVIEPRILQSVVTVSDLNSEEDCVHLCKSGDVLTLGVFSSDWEKKGHLMRDFPTLDLVVTEITSPDPRQLSVDKSLVPSSVATHYFVHHSYSTRPLIHLVVFYQRPDNYLWHSKLQLTNKTHGLQLIPEQLTFGKHAGAFDRFPVRLSRVDGISLHLPHTVKEFLTQLPQSTFVECDYQQAKTFLSKYPQDLSEDAQQFQRKARQLLSRARNILNELDVRFWLSSGTCLGWFRECGIISYSKDIDFGVWIKDYQEDIVSAFEGQGFTLKHIFGKESDSYELSFKAGEIKIDIFFFYEEGSYMWNGGTEARTGLKYKYYFPTFDICWTEFLGLRVRIPCPTLPYITANYGQGWSVPVKQWDWKSSPPNVKENGMWPKEEWDSVIQVYE